MKTIFVLALTLVSLQAFACPNISGAFRDEDGNVLTITQNKCESTTWSDGDGSTTLIADNVERVVQQEGDDVAYGKARFTNTDFVLELRVVFKIPNNYPTNILTSYRVDKFNNLVEKIESSEGTSYVTFRRVQ